MSAMFAGIERRDHNDIDAAEERLEDLTQPLPISYASAQRGDALLDAEETLEVKGCEGCEMGNNLCPCDANAKCGRQRRA